MDGGPVVEPAGPTPPDETDELDRLQSAVLAVPGVTGLHGGPYGALATYLPGRRVVGIRRRDDHTEIHVTVGTALPVRHVADDVRRAVRAVVDLPVRVTVEDVTA
ncbi:hypothetical protein [Terrabacter carboxydivorans]